MKKGKVLKVLMTGAVLLCALGSPVRAEEGSPLIDPARTAKLTLFKLRENGGAVSKGDGNPVSPAPQQGMKGIVFGALKIAEIESIAGEEGVGTYFTNLDPGFLSLCSSNSIEVHSSTIDNKSCYTSSDLMEALTALCCVSGTNPGEVQINAYVRDSSSTCHMMETNERGETVRDQLPLGLYLVAETNCSGYSAVTDAMNDGTEIREGITNPSSPFLVSLPMSNQDSDSPVRWQYDVTAYPKNQTASVPKYIVSETDGSTLLMSEDFEIGETVHQIIAPSAPAVAHLLSDTVDNRNYEKYVVSDVMDQGLSFVRITSVRLGARVYSPSSITQFTEGYQVLTPGKDYRVLKGLSGEELLGDSNAQGTKSFRVEMLGPGLDKLNALNRSGQVAVCFDAVVTKDAKAGEAVPNQNQPSLTWKHRNTVESKLEGNKVNVYSYRLDLRKEGVNDASKISFSVRRNNIDLEFIKESSGLYHVFDKDLDDSAGKTKLLIPTSAGALAIRGLDADSYEFTERSTESGHELLKSTFQVTFRGKHPVDGTLKEAALSADGKSTALTIRKGTAGITVKNMKSFLLRTGGVGNTVLFAAALLFLSAGTVLILHRRREV